MKYLFIIVAGLFVISICNVKSVNDSFLDKYNNKEISVEDFYYLKKQIIEELHEKRFEYKLNADYSKLFKIFSQLAKIYSDYDNIDSTLFWFREADLLLKSGRIINKKLVYEYYLIKSRAYLNFGMYNKSLDYYQKSKSNAGNYQNDTLIYLENIINCYFNIYKCDYKNAYSILENSYPSFRNYLSENKIERIYFTSLLSDILIFNGQTAKAGALLNDKFELDIVNYSDSLHPVILKYLISKAFSLYHNGMYESGIKYINKAEKLANFYFKDGNSNLSGIILLRKGELLLYTKNYYMALEYFNASLRIFDKYPDAVREKAEIFYKLGSVYTDLSDNKKSIQYFNKNIETNKIIKYTDPRTCICLAICYKNENDFVKARSFLNIAEQIIKENYDNSAYMLYYVYRLHSIIAKNTENIELEKVFLTKAYNIIVANGNDKNTDLADVLMRLGRYYRNTDSYLSLEYYQKALKVITVNFNGESVYANPSIENTFNRIKLASILNEKAYSFYLYFNNVSNDIKDLEACLKCYEIASAIRAKIGTEFLREDEKLTYVNKQKNVVNNTIEVALDLYKITNNKDYLDKAFGYSEKGKAIVLTSFLNQENAKSFSGIPDSIIEYERALERTIKNITYQLEQSNDYVSHKSQNNIEFLQEELFLQYKKQADLERYYEKNYSNYYNLKFNSSFINFKEVQNILDKDQVILEYTLTKTNQLYTFYISKDTFDVVIQEIDTSFISNIKKVRYIISNYDVNRNQYYEFVDFENSAQYLYKILIEPVKEIVQNKSLVIVPDDVLNLIPFEILVDNSKKTKKMDYSNMPYLIKQNPVSYAYSILLMDSKREKQKNRKTRYIAFAPSYNKNDSSDLLPLTGSLQEVKSISQWFKGSVFLGDDASEDNFKKQVKKSNIVHLSLHAIINDNNPDLSRLIFAKGGREDGLLHNFEIYGLQINSQLLVLSSCSTGMGELNKGEGLLSLARGFKYAGVSNIILTQWTVSDITAAELMQDFYFNLSEGENVENALRLAKLNILLKNDQVRSHPYFWAGYLCYGNSAKFNSKSRNTCKYALTIIAGICTISFLNRKRLVYFFKNFLRF